MKGDTVDIYVTLLVINTTRPGEIIKLKVDRLAGEVGSLERSVKGILEPTLFHLRQIDEGNAA